MLLTITSTHRPATDLGFLLHKHPDRVQAFPVPFGRAHVFYPEATDDRCTAALLLEIDPVGLVRRGGGPTSFALADYVNDRPYVASSFLSVALVTVFKSAMAGTCNGHEELAGSPIALEASLPVVPARGGVALVRELFEPLGYDVDVTAIPLDPDHPDWGESRYVSLRLAGHVRLADLLTHLYVLLPVLDDEKHYWVDEAEIDKLMRRGEGWLPGHPQRDLIVRRYLKKQASLYFPALAQLDDASPAADGGADERGPEPEPEKKLEDRVSLRDLRLDAVQAVLRASGARRVLDLGCGAGALLGRLIADDYDLIVGADVSVRALEQAGRRLKLDDMHDAQRRRISLIHSPLTYRDKRLTGFDAAVLVEVIEHFDPSRLAAVEQNVFGSARPPTVVVTTPNAEYNTRWETLPAGERRHPDHRFEWTRAEFAGWTRGVCERHGYAVRHLPIGPDDAELGPPTQMAVFDR
ncbi:MAG TPA: 3' terminal RNA ribose 2'-O-methyltransferase Hen1 [Solirubrobacteraceae bacterium]|nr:3' terminal RNA ribose 2'-O-methyltransferase Hen1 [Solirubrobacteraceae bacterium]